jgi:hypothetical protein
MNMRVLALCLLALTGTACLDVKVQNKAPIASVQLVSVNGTAYSDLSKDPTMALPLRTPMGFPNPVAQVFSGAPATVVLSAMASRDPDGEIEKYTWLRTDLPRGARFPATVPMAGMAAPAAGMTGGAGMGAAGMGAAGMGAAGMGAAGMGAAGMGAAGMMGPPPPPAPGAPAGLATVGDPDSSSSMVTIELPSVGSYRFTVWTTDDKDYVSVPASITIDVRPPPAAP